MSATKNEILKDLNYCKESLDRIIRHTEKYYGVNYVNHHTVIQADIIKLRRELNEINKKFAWEYGRKE
jgi:hypothetical protein